jgi:hypothetical protein
MHPDRKLLAVDLPTVAVQAGFKNSLQIYDRAGKVIETH